MSTQVIKRIQPAAPSVPIYLCGTPTDMRLGLPGLAAKVKNEQRDPKEKAMYIFVSRDFKRIKLFYWDGNGYAMWYKMVPEGVFYIEIVNGYQKITGVRLKELISATKKPKIR